MPDEICRIAKLEQRADDAEEWTGKIEQKIDKILEIQQRQKGFVAGVVFTVGALASGLTWFLQNKFN